MDKKEELLQAVLAWLNEHGALRRGALATIAKKHGVGLHVLNQYMMEWKRAGLVRPEETAHGYTRVLREKIKELVRRGALLDDLPEMSAGYRSRLLKTDGIRVVKVLVPEDIDDDKVRDAIGELVQNEQDKVAHGSAVDS